MDSYNKTLAIAAALTTCVVLTGATLALLSSRREAAERAEFARRKLARKKKDADEKSKGFPLNIWFGGQTGTAEGFAKEIAEKATKYGFSSKVLDLEDFEGESSLSSGAISVFVLATYGEGDPSDNAVEFHAWLNDAEELESPSELKFVVFGLGNTQYEHYNAMAKLTHRKLLDLGGSCVYPYGEGDDDGTLEEDFENWSEDMYESLSKTAFGENAARARAQTSLPVWKYRCEYLIDAKTAPQRFDASKQKFPSKKVCFSSKCYFKAFPVLLVEKRELRQSSGADKLGSTLHLEFKLPKGLTYAAADNFAILPQNSPEDVELAAKLLKIDHNLDSVFVLKSDESDAEIQFPTPTTVRTALECYCALNHLPGKALLQKLAFFAADPSERSDIEDLVSKTGKKRFHDEVVSKKLTILQALKKWKSITISDFAHFVEFCPRLVSRDYTICSTPSVDVDVHAVVSVVTEKDPDFNGACTHTLKRANVQDTLYAFVKRSAFVLPKNDDTPILMIGPGTGIAPMRALLRERQHRKSFKNYLYFGCRSPTEDYLYKDELEKMAESGVVNLRLAFSRTDPLKKTYVQHLIEEDGNLIFDLVHEKKAFVYVCGGTLMGRDVGSALEKVLRSEGGLSEEQATAYLKKMVDVESRYISELWS